MTANEQWPRVAVIILNYNGWRFLPMCLDALAQTEYPSDRLDILVVDNASQDDSIAQLRTHYPNVRVLALNQNLGFAGGNNAGICAMGAVKGQRSKVKGGGSDDLQPSTFDVRPEYIVLLNNDTAVDSHWLKPLVRAAQADPCVGACGSKLVFFYERLPLTIHVERSFIPGRDLGSSDTRVLGVRLGSVDLPGAALGAHVDYGAGWYDREGSGDATYRWSSDCALLQLPVADRTAPLDLTLRFAGGPPDPLPAARLHIKIGDDVLQTVEIGSEPATITLTIPAALVARAQRFIQNAGQELLPGGYCRDRGSYVENGVEQHVPDGSYERQEEVFGICGAAMLLRRAMLDQVGVLDHRFFMYYEDVDLCWRARFAGWKMVYVPGSVVRHVHSGSSGAWSPLFRFHVERNRLLMLVKNAPRDLAITAVKDYVGETGAWIGRSVRAIRSGWPSVRANLFFVRNNTRVLLSLIKLLPYLLRQRRLIRRAANVPDSAILSWMIDPRMHTKNRK